jgi:hypothetical protein
MGFLRRLAKRRSVWLVFGSVLIVAGTAAATSILFQQSFPSVTSSGLISNCANLEADNVATNGGSVTFDCPPNAASVSAMPAFIVLAAGTYIPSFSALPTGDVLSIFPSSDSSTQAPGTPCPSYTGNIVITSGSTVSLTVGVSYDYCYALSGGHITTPAFIVYWL